MSDAKKAAVKELGFGGLMEIKMTEMPRNMVRWLCKRFVCNARLLRISAGKEFQVTEEDVHDMFLLPLGPLPVPTYNVKEDNHTKETWRNYFVVDKEITLAMLERQLTTLPNAGKTCLFIYLYFFKCVTFIYINCCFIFVCHVTFSCFGDVTLYIYF